MLKKLDLIYSLTQQLKLTNKALELLRQSYYADIETKERVEDKVRLILVKRSNYQYTAKRLIKEILKREKSTQAGK